MVKTLESYAGNERVPASGCDPKKIRHCAGIGEFMLGCPWGRIVRVGPVIRIGLEMFVGSKVGIPDKSPQDAPSEWIALLKENLAVAGRVMASLAARLKPSFCSTLAVIGLEMKRWRLLSGLTPPASD